MLGGKAKLAGGLFIGVSLLIIGASVFLLGESLVDGAVSVVKNLESGEIDVPPPTESVKEWPVVGPKVYEYWSAANTDLTATLQKLSPMLKTLSARLAASFAGLAGATLQMFFAIIIAGILMISAEGGQRSAMMIAKRLAGDDGPPMVHLSVGTIRSVVKGVLLVAIIQGILAAVGLAIAGVPGVGLWALLVIVVAVIQLPPILILGPIAAFVFATNDNTVIAVFFLIWSLVVSGADGFLKPMLLGRGVQVPMLVILIGAIGGMLRSGVVGLFIGPVILAIAFTLFMAWVKDDDEAKDGTAVTEPSG